MHNADKFAENKHIQMIKRIIQCVAENRCSNHRILSNVTLFVEGPVQIHCGQFNDQYVVLLYFE